MTNEEKANLRKVEIEILDYIVSICEENGLDYFLLYGTLLGCIRHKGFIPWDDDIDIGLPRAHYSKLCSILGKLCSVNGSKYFFQSIETDMQFALPFSKLRKNGTLFLEQGNKDKSMHHGVFVDIFPLDKAKHKKGLQKIFSFFIYRLYAMSSKTGHLCFAKIANKLMQFYEGSDYPYYVSYGSVYPVEKDISKKEWFSKKMYGLFEGKHYRIPSAYDQYLHNLYGDYMDLPPVEKRNAHEPIMIRL